MTELIFTDATFEKDVLQAKGVVIVDFFAPWCGPCKMMAPVIEKLAEEYDGKAVIGKLNIDENQDIATKLGIQSIPIFIMFKNGQAVDKVVGAVGEPGINLIAQKFS